MKDGHQPAAIDVFALARRDTFARSLGIEIIEASLGRAVTRVTIEDRHINFNGVAHGGLTFALAGRMTPRAAADAVANARVAALADPDGESLSKTLAAIAASSPALRHAAE